MIKSDVLDQLTQGVLELLPEALRQMQADSQQHLRIGVQALLQRMELVTREEFAVQTAVLARTREKLVRLEQQVAALEKQGRNG